jgi:dephospho-CoA kinase
MVGLSGGIGSGKSLVAARLAELGAIVIDSDRLAREEVAPGTEGLAEVVAEFGTGVLGPDGALDRPALGRLVFGDEPARRRLEAIIHPRVRTRTAELVAAASPDAIVVNDVPLLAEAGLVAGFDIVIMVLANEETRVRRLVQTRSMSVEQARSRIRAQATDEERRAVADLVLENDGSPAQLRDEVDALWREHLLPATERTR